MQYSDWSLNGGSDIYRQARANGAFQINGTQYARDADGKFQVLSDRGGRIGFWNMNVSRTPNSLSSDGYAIATEMVFVIAQQGGPGDPIKWFGTWTDINSSDYPGIKIYQTSLVIDGTGVTVPGVGILISQTIKPGLGMTQMLQHEYGHFLDSKFSPDLNNSFNPTVPSAPFLNYMFIIGIPSAFDLMRGSNYDEHHDFYTEKRAGKNLV